MVKHTLRGHGRQRQEDESATSPPRGLTAAELDEIVASHLRAIFADVDRRRRVRRNRQRTRDQIRQLPIAEQLELLHANAAESAGRSANV